VDFTGYGRYAIPHGYPAVADPDLVSALRLAAEKYGRSAHSGIVLTSDVFYDGIHPSISLYQDLSRANVQAVEMECSALFIIGSLRGVQTGAILAVDGNVLEQVETVDTFNPDQAAVKTAVDDAIQIALQALAQG
jgi:uridine phosphorylase